MNHLKESVDTQSHYEPSIAPSITSTTASMRAARGFCLEHPEEEISYFCFDCLTDCICPECVIHGVHKNHEVQTIRKSYPIIKSRVRYFIIFFLIYYCLVGRIETQDPIQNLSA